MPYYEEEESDDNILYFVYHCVNKECDWYGEQDELVLGEETETGWVTHCPRCNSHILCEMKGTKDDDPEWGKMDEEDKCILCGNFVGYEYLSECSFCMISVCEDCLTEDYDEEEDEGFFYCKKCAKQHKLKHTKWGKM